nr:MAG TPA: hypothetical protein [Caudoviricetes sp.]
MHIRFYLSILHKVYDNNNQIFYISFLLCCIKS